MTQDIANADPDKQVSIAIADPTVSARGLSAGRTGTLTVVVNVAPFSPSQGPPSPQPLQLYQQNNVGATPQNQPITFGYNLSSLGAPVAYSNVTATWYSLHVGGSQNFTTMGPYYFTQYNSISEQTCAPGPATAYIFAGDGTCNYSILADQKGLQHDFITQVTENGTGVSVNPNVGLIAAFRATGLFTYGTCAFPPGSNQDENTGNVFVKIPAVEGSCNQQLASGSLAVYPNPNPGTGIWNCQDQVALLNNSGNPNQLGTILPVQDFCPACKNYPAGTEGHIDVFSTTQACYRVGDYSATPIQGVRLR